MLFADRRDAARRLAKELAEFRDQHPAILALPRGGVVIGAEIASQLNAPLDVVIVRKLGAPMQPEYAIGAVAEGGARYVNDEAAEEVGLSEADVDDLATQQTKIVEQRIRRYRHGRPPLDLRGKIAILVDDGIATGNTVFAAIRAIRDRNPAQLILAVPVGPEQSIEALRPEVDRLICLASPADFFAISQYYRSFPQVEDDEVIDLLRAHAGTSEASPMAQVQDEQNVKIPLFDVTLDGTLAIPDDALGLVMFAHGSGSSRLSPRNQFVASQLRRAGLGTFLFDLLSQEEEEVDDAELNYRFDIGFLARRLLATTDWLERAGLRRGLKLGYFGSSTGAAAALVAAAIRPSTTLAVVSRGGRPDLALDALPEVRTPTLLIVGGADDEVIRLNRKAMSQMMCERKLVIVPGATHLFEEPGALEQVAQLAGGWFRQCFSARPEAEARV